MPGSNLQVLLDQTDDRAGYDLEIDYTKEPEPPLDDEMAAWADGRCARRGCASVRPRAPPARSSTKEGSMTA